MGPSGPVVHKREWKVYSLGQRLKSVNYTVMQPWIYTTNHNKTNKTIGKTHESKVYVWLRDHITTTNHRTLSVVFTPKFLYFEDRL